MANTPPRPPIQERSNEVLLEDICRELRHVAVCDNDLPNGERVKSHIAEVRSPHKELSQRKIDLADRITVLSTETSWLMKELLDDCLAYPEKLPYVRDAKDGVRYRLRCRLCGRGESPPGAKVFGFCDSCMGRIALAIHDRKPCEGIVIFRTYNPESRCIHADADTPLAAKEWPEPERIYGVCETCVLGEIERRKGSLSA